MRLPRTPITWPNDARVAIMPTIVLETWPTEELGKPGSAQAQFRDDFPKGSLFTTDIALITDRLYGERCGAYRMLDILEEAGVHTSWFLNGEPTLKIVVKTGNAGTATANKDLRLPAPYQLPIAVILNGRGGSAPEVFAASLKENKRATIVGSRSVGCLGATSPTAMSDGSTISVTVQEFTGAVTGFAYNNHGVKEILDE